MNEHTSDSDIDSGSDDDYAPIVASSWGDQAPKPTADNSNDEEENKQDKVNDWTSLIDPNAKLSENGLGSGDLHRRGPNYRPVDETLILQQRLQGASLKTEEEKKAHRERNAREKRKMMRYVRELEGDRPTPRRFSSNSRKPARSFSSSTRGGKKSFSSPPRSSLSSSTRKYPFSSTDDTTTTTSTTTPTTKTEDVEPPPLPPIENKPLIVYRETAPWDDVSTTEEITPLPPSQPQQQQTQRQSSQPSAEQQQQAQRAQLKKKASVRFSHPLVQPPPVTLHSPKSTKSTTTIENDDSTSKNSHIDSTATTITTTLTAPAAVAAAATTSSNISSTADNTDNTTSTAVKPKPTPLLPPAVRPPSTSTNSNPWAGKPLMEEPFWKGPADKIKEEEKKEDVKLIEEVEPQQSLQKVDTSSGASKWSSGDVLTPSPVTTPTKRTVPPPWHPPPSADWVNDYMAAKSKSVTKSDGSISSTDHSNPQTASKKVGGWQTPSLWNPPTSTKAPSTPVSHNDSSNGSEGATTAITTTAASNRSDTTTATTASNTPLIPAKPATPVASPTQPPKEAPPAAAVANWQSSVPPAPEKPATPPTSTADNTDWQYTTANTITTITTPPQAPAKSITPPGGQFPSSMPAPTKNTSSGGSSTTATTMPASNNNDSRADASKFWDSSDSSSLSDSTSITRNDSVSDTWKDAAASSWNDSSVIQGWNNNTNTTWKSDNNGWDSDAAQQPQQQQPARVEELKREQTTAPSRFSRPNRPKYSARSKGPTPANYRADKPLSPPTKVAPPSRADNPVVVSINVELSADKKIPVHIHLYDDPLNVARNFAQVHSIHSPNIIEALNQLFSSQKAQAVKQRSQYNVNNTPPLPPPPRGYHHQQHQPNHQYHQYRGRYDSY